MCLKTPLSSLLITSLALRKISSFPSQMSLCYLFAGSLPTEKLDLNFFVFFYIPILRLYFPIKSQSKHIFSLRKDRHTILPKSFLEYLLLLSVYLEEDAEDRLQGLQNLPWFSLHVLFVENIRKKGQTLPAPSPTAHIEGRSWDGGEENEYMNAKNGSWTSIQEIGITARNAGDPGSIPDSGRSPGEGNGDSLQHSCLENPMDGGAS